MIASYRRLFLSLSLVGVTAVRLCAQTPTPAIALAPADNQFFDLLVVYTPAARAYAGSATAMNSSINSYVALANTCFANSAMSTRMRLVGTAEVAYTETSGGSMNTDLSWLMGSSTVDALRKQYGADLICLIRRGPVGTTSGTAEPNNSFSVVADDQAATTLAFPHEIGHCLGAKHDRASEGNVTYTYDCYGHRFTGQDGVQYRTIMANGSGIRIPHFSNPAVTYHGVPTGIAFPAIDAADNARVIELKADAAVDWTPSREVLLAGDFSGDGTANFILAGADYRLRYWQMSGTTRVSANYLAEVFTGVWTVFGSGDLNGDGKSDLLFKSTDGRIAVWFMNGASRASAALVPDTFLPNNWTPFGAGDLNGDGKDDLLFRSSVGGRIAVWYMNGSIRTSAAVLADTYVPAVPLSQGGPSGTTPFGAGDLNGDGHDDLLFYSSTGGIYVWFMNGAIRTSVGSVPVLFSSIWTPVGAADYDGDGKEDLVFQSTDERGAIWFMNGTTRVSSDVLSHPLNTL